MPVPVCHNYYPHSDRTKVRCTVRRYEFIPVHALRQSIDNRTHQLADGPGFCGVETSFHVQRCTP